MSLTNWEKDASKKSGITVISKSERRNKNNIKMLHHNAYRCRNAEETRHFYEDILEMPLVAALVEPIDPVTNKPDPYMHLYFELADGSCLAFFDFPACFEREGATFKPNNPFMHHIALEVKGEEVLQEYMRRVREAGIDFMELDHGYCHSIYIPDPNGMLVELTTNVALTEQFFDDAAATAHSDLAQWMEMRSSPKLVAAS